MGLDTRCMMQVSLVRMQVTYEMKIQFNDLPIRRCLVPQSNPTQGFQESQKPKMSFHFEGSSSMRRNLPLHCFGLILILTWNALNVRR